MTQNDANGSSADGDRNANQWMDDVTGDAAGDMPIDDVQSDDATTAEIAQLKGELDDLQNRLLRVSADYQNFARRAQQNVIEAREQQTRAIARALLTVLDHFDRALQADATKVTAQSLLQGVQIVRDELSKTLEQFEVRRIDAQVGDVFDPLHHEAVMRQHVDGLEANHVAMVLEPGYTLADKTLRPVKVAVTE